MPILPKREGVDGLPVTKDVSYQRARACQVLLALAGLEGETLWTERGPSKRASWMKGYIRRQPSRRHSPNGAVSRPLSWIDALSYREKTILLVAFDFWNGSGGVPFAEVLNLTPRLVFAVAGLMEAFRADQVDLFSAWIARWAYQDPRD